MPRKVSAPTTPSARGRGGPPNRCDAAAVPTGTSTPPPTAWTSRAAMSWSSDWAAPGQRGPEGEDDERAHEQPAGAPQVGQPAGHRHRQDVDQQVAVDDPARLAQLDPGGATGRVGQVGQDRRQRDRGDHELEAGQEDPDPDDGEQHDAERRSIPRSVVAVEVVPGGPVPPAGVGLRRRAGPGPPRRGPTGGWPRSASGSTVAQPLRAAQSRAGGGSVAT